MSAEGVFPERDMEPPAGVDCECDAAVHAGETFLHWCCPECPSEDVNLLTGRRERDV